MNISSASAVMSLSGYCPYGVAKAALVKFTEDSVVTVPGVRHNAVLPGFVDTPIVRNAYGDAAMDAVEPLLKSISPVPRMGTPADIAGAVAFLASNDASFITGACLLVDGGISQLSGISIALSTAAR